jgi:hypothetical protein
MKYMIAAYLLDIDDMNNTNNRMMINTNDTIHHGIETDRHYTVR